MENTNTYILNVEAKHIFSNNKNYKIKGKDKKEKIMLYNGCLPLSMDLMELEKQSKYKTFNLTENKKCTNAVINVTFEESYTDNTGEHLTLKKMREELYKNGFKLDGKNYVMYKRSSSKSRVGSCLFIIEDLYKKMINWSRLNVKFVENEEVDLASLKAYESLTLSSIEGTVNIKSDEILLIPDMKKSFESTASVTEIKNGEIVVDNERKLMLTSDIWDGQSLLDESLFENEYSSKGVLLLRNRFLKSAGFNTKIQEYFTEHNIKVVYDMFGRELDAKKIKMITTPNSLKFLKFAYKFENKEKAYDYWLKNIDSNFGICKTEKESHYLNCNQLSYQIINSLQMSKEEVQELMKDEIKYIDNLQNNITVFKKHISLSNESISREFITSMLSYNDNIKYTKMFKEFRKEVVRNYKNRLKKGKVKIQNADYCVLFGNPFEMLTYAGMSINERNKDDIKFLHQGTEVYCTKFKNDDELCGFRNPHICSGNVLYCKNTYKEEFKYFNLTDNIVILNSHDNDILDRLQGADFDIDTMLLISNKLLVKKARECLEYKTPVKLIDSKNTPKKLNSEYAAELDFMLSKNLIGEVINLSQILNSYYWQEYYKKDADEDLLDLIYGKISLLSSLSQVEIDKAKKTFENLDVAKELEIIKEIELDDELLVQKEKVYEKKTINNIKSEVKHNFVKKSKDEIKEEITKRYAKYKEELAEGNDKKTKTEFGKEIRKEIRTKEKVELEELQQIAIKEYYSNFNRLEKEYLETKDETLRDKLYICKCKQIRPKFFKEQLSEEDKKKNNYVYRDFNCSMDYLIEVVEQIKKAKKMKHKEVYIEELFKESKIGKSNRNQIQKIEEKAEEITKEKNKLYLDFVSKLKNTDNKEEEYKKYKIDKFEKQEEFVEYLQKLEITEATIKSLLCRMYSKKKNKNATDELSKYKLTIFSTLYKAHTGKLLNVFKSTNKNYEKLKKDKDGDIDIFGVKYKIKKR